MDAPKHTQAEDDFLKEVCQYAARKASNGVLIEQLYSKSVGAPVLLVFALGDQALAIQQIIMKAAVPDEGALIERANGAGNGKF